MSVAPDLAVERFEDDQVISVSVLDDMRLIIEPAEVARAAEHNAATFRIVRQPASLDAYVCRAEVQTAAGTNYRLVVDGEFLLTSDVAVQGVNQLQLVYSDGADITRKTYKAPFHVSASINALDESDPEFQDGLGQITRAAFTDVRGTDTAATFYNIAGQEVAVLPYPPGQGGGIDEATGDLLYVRRDGANTMEADLRMIPAAGTDAPIEIVLGGRFATIGWDIGGTLLRRGQAGEPVSIANNDGSQRSQIVTEQSGDQRYATLAYTETAYARISGANFTGPIITAPGSSVTNPGLGIGDNATGFFRAGSTLLLTVGGALYAQWLGSPASLMMTVPLNMAASNGITNLADPVAPQDAVNRRTMDAAIAAIPGPIVPASRVFIPNEITIATTPVEFFNQPFFTNDNAPRTIVVTVYPQFSGGQPSSFYDLEYSTNLSVGLIERSTVYPTAQGYMGGGQAVCFAATVTPVSSQIQVSLSVRMMAANPGPDLIQIGSRATQRSYVLIQEMTT